jgi:hypothetical protein
MATGVCNQMRTIPKEYFNWNEMQKRTARTKRPSIAGTDSTHDVKLFTKCQLG